MAERLLGRVGSAGRALLESSALQILPKQLAARNENNHSAQNNAVAKSDSRVLNSTEMIHRSQAGWMHWAEFL